MFETPSHKSSLFFEQDIITLLEYDELMTAEDIEYGAQSPHNSSSCTDESGIFIRETSVERNVSEIEMLLNRIHKDKKDKALQWLQKSLIECCYVKVALQNRSVGEMIYGSKLGTAVLEPVPFHYTSKICYNTYITCLSFLKKHFTLVQYNLTNIV